MRQNTYRSLREQCSRRWQPLCWPPRHFGGLNKQARCGRIERKVARRQRAALPMRSMDSIDTIVAVQRVPAIATPFVFTQVPRIENDVMRCLQPYSHERRKGGGECVDWLCAVHCVPDAVTPRPHSAAALCTAWPVSGRTECRAQLSPSTWSGPKRKVCSLTLAPVLSCRMRSLFCWAADIDPPPHLLSCLLPLSSRCSLRRRNLRPPAYAEIAAVLSGTDTGALSTTTAAPAPAIVNACVAVVEAAIAEGVV
jgi:hypothetical protein